jgi:hypothetical protein
MTRYFLIVTALLLLAPPAALAQQTIQTQLDSLKREPSVRHVQEASLRYFRVNVNTVNSMRRRASWKSILPVTEISGGYIRSNSDEQTQNYEVFLDGRDWLIKGAGGDAYEMRGKLSWNLPNLIFNPEELDVASLAGLMEGILKESTRLYFMRRRLQVDMILTPPTDRASLLSKELRKEELTGLLDAMTGGWFQQELRRRATLGKAGKGTQKTTGKRVAKPSVKPPSVLRRN